MDKLLSFTPEPFPELDREAEYDELDPLAGEWETEDTEDTEEEVRRGRRPRLSRKAPRQSVRKPTVRQRVPSRATGPRVKPLRQLPKLMPRPLPVPALRPVPIPFIPPQWGLRPGLEPVPPLDPQRPEESRRPEQAGSEGSGSTPSAQPSEEPASEHVRWVQRCLNQIMGLQLLLDGIMNAQTRSAVRSFQERRGLPVDGLIGPPTEAALVAACAGTPPPTADHESESDQEWELVEMGLSGQQREQEGEQEIGRNGPDYVRWIQGSLNKILDLRLAVDGVMGPQTRSAVRSLQQQQGLFVDGIVGPETIDALRKATGTNTSISNVSRKAPSCSTLQSPVSTPVLRSMEPHSLVGQPPYGWSAMAGLRSTQRQCFQEIGAVSQRSVKLRTSRPQARQFSPSVQPTAGGFRSALFQGDPDLLTVLQGQLRLGRPADPQYPAPIKSLGTMVAKIQQALVQLGYPTSVDGKYGNQTYNKVLSYKRRYGILTETGHFDGIVGPKTIRHMDDALAEQEQEASKPTVRIDVVQISSKDSTIQLRGFDSSISSGIKIQPRSINVTIGQRIEAIATGNPRPYGSPAYTWSIADLDVAKVEPVQANNSQTHPNRVIITGNCAGKTTVGVACKVQSGRSSSVIKTQKDIIVRPSYFGISAAVNELKSKIRECKPLEDGMGYWKLTCGSAVDKMVSELHSRRAFPGCKRSKHKVTETLYTSIKDEGGNRCCVVQYRDDLETVIKKLHDALNDGFLVKASVLSGVCTGQAGKCGEPTCCNIPVPSNRIPFPDHWILIVGHDGENRFVFWDPNGPDSNATQYCAGFGYLFYDVRSNRFSTAANDSEMEVRGGKHVSRARSGESRYSVKCCRFQPSTPQHRYQVLTLTTV